LCRVKVDKEDSRMGSNSNLRRRYLTFLYMAGLTFLLLIAAGCDTSPDWRALYSDRLGNQIIELDKAALEQAFTDPVESGSLTRVAWAKLQNGDIVFLGLPPARLSPEEVVEQTVILRPSEWRDACGDALGQDEIWGMRMPHAHRGNSIRMYINNQNDRYCQFFFLPEGWELRAVASQGIIKPFH
jgi:hypothetical protein